MNARSYMVPRCFTELLFNFCIACQWLSCFLNISMKGCLANTKKKMNNVDS